jgi:solute:Na+ symporter, SSS family
MIEHSVNGVTIAVFLVLFLLVTVLGFVAARWRRGDLQHLNEWGLGGRGFNTFISWFLLGGDLYTAYTFIAVPALVFGVGAVGFFALPYTVILYPIGFLFMARLWSVCARHNYVTPADFVKGRYRNSGLALSVAFTGLLATMPYIALQLIGIKVVVQAMGVKGDLPIIIAFVVLAAYTYQSGLRAPALIAFVKDTLIYVTVLVAIIYLPSKVGGWGHVFDVAGEALPKKKPEPGALIPGKTAAHTTYATLAIGSALALFLYPHCITGVLSSKSQDVVKRNMALLPAYSLMLGLLALLGYVAIAAKLQPEQNFAVPDLFLRFFPSWFEGFAFAAIAIGALVPAAVMSIAAANLFTRNVYREYFKPDCTHREETQVARVVSLAVKAGALAFVLFLPNKYAIDLQLLGGVWILQTFPAVVLGLYTRWFDARALLLGWLVGMITGTLMASSQDFAPAYPLDFLGISVTAYTAVFAFVANVVVSSVGTLVLRSAGAGDRGDDTAVDDYDELRETGVPAPVMGGSN